MLTSNTAKNHSTVATSYSAYAKAAGIFMMTTGIFLFAKTTRYLFPSFFSRKTEEDASTALITKDEIQSITSMMQDTISLNEVNGFEMGVSTGDSMATDPAENEQVQFTELTLLKSSNTKTVEKTISSKNPMASSVGRKLLSVGSEFLLQSDASGWLGMDARGNGVIKLVYTAGASACGGIFCSATIDSNGSLISGTALSQHMGVTDLYPTIAALTGGGNAFAWQAVFAPTGNTADVYKKFR